MFEMEDFENRLIEYGQMPGGETLRELYNLNQIKGEKRSERKPFLQNLAAVFMMV